MSPTRELALQTADFVRALGRFTDIRACLLIGGDNLEDQVSFDIYARMCVCMYVCVIMVVMLCI